MSDTPATPPRDNLLGICHAIAACFGFDALYLRVGLLVALLVNFPATVLAYALAGLAVGLGRAIEWAAGRRFRRAGSTHRVEQARDRHEGEGDRTVGDTIRQEQLVAMA